MSVIRDLADATPEILDVFGDAAMIRHALAFEAALAQACAKAGLIDSEEEKAVSKACATMVFEPAELGRAAAHAGTLAIPLVEALRARVSLDCPRAAAAVHRGATSQDLADTILVLQLKAAMAIFRRDIGRLSRALLRLTEQHIATPMLGRTLLQPALPITFGQKTCGWLQAVDEAQGALGQSGDHALVLQFGGPVGALTGLEGKGMKVAEYLSAILELPCPDLPWQSRPGNMAALASAVGIIIGVLGKIAGDIALMAQGEVGELHEPQIVGRGGSSAMARKRNPTGCQVALSAAYRAPGLVASLFAAMTYEHERALGGWQILASVMADLVSIGHGALASMVTVIEGLVVDTAAMARNLQAAGAGSEVSDSVALVRHMLATRKVKQ